MHIHRKQTNLMKKCKLKNVNDAQYAETDIKEQQQQYSSYI